MDKSFIEKSVLRNEFLISEHAHQERQNEKIKVSEIKKILLEGEIIEKYPKDPRGESCLIAGIVDKGAIHAVCGKRMDKLLIVTVYLPKMPKWLDWKTRNKEVKSRV